MNLTGLLFGAGASHEFGMPVARGLTEELRRWLTPDWLDELNAGWRARGLGFPDEAISTLATVLTVESMNYEHIMGHLQVQGSRDADEWYHRLLTFLSEIVYAMLKERHVLNLELIAHGMSRLAGIAGLAEINRPLWVFSLNHDLIMECLAAHARLPMKSGFNDEVIHLPRRNVLADRAGGLEGRVLRRSRLASGRPDFFNLGEHGINLLKLHGSLDEFVINDDQDLLKLTPLHDSVQGVIQTLQIANEKLRYVDPRFAADYAVGVNEIAYQDDDGEVQLLKRTPLAGLFKFQNQSAQTVPSEFLSLFESRLLYVTNLVCVGYGFGDPHVNQAIRDWLELRGDTRLIIVDPTITQVPATFLHLHPQINLVQAGATEYFDSVGGTVSSRLPV